MKLIHPRIEILEQQPGLQGMYDMIELCGKTSYKSPVQGGQVAKNFVSARVNEGHYAVLEFGTVYLKYPGEEDFVKYHENPYSLIHLAEDGDFAITTNLRVLVENGWTSDLQYWCEPTEYHAKRYTARVITDRGTTHEIVRHRSMSFVQESTRYCNYTKDKFGNELTFILPPWMSLDEEDVHFNTREEMYIWCASKGLNPVEESFINALYTAERIYPCLINDQPQYQWTAQQARQVLPNALKTEICVCGFEDAWEHFFALRYHGTTGKPHPSMYEVAEMLKFGFEKKGIEF